VFHRLRPWNGRGGVDEIGAGTATGLVIGDAVMAMVVNSGSHGGYRESIVLSELLTPLLRSVHRVITGFLLRQAGLEHSATDAGSVTLIQRFGSAANLNIHLHCLVLDGVYRRTEDEPIFEQAHAPSGEELQGLLDKLIARVMKMLTRSGHLVEEQGMT